MGIGADSDAHSEEQQIGESFFPTLQESQAKARASSLLSPKKSAWSAKKLEDGKRTEQEKRYMQQKAQYWDERLGRSPDQPAKPRRQNTPGSGPRGAW